MSRLGEYCSYCELPILNQPAIEHIMAKGLRFHPELERTWCNFLLGCCWCNAIKGARDRFVLSEYFWPDRDNTLRALAYEEGGLVRTALGLSSADEKRAQATIELTGLDRGPSKTPKASAGDPRWRKRREAWELAVEERNDLARHDTERMRKQIVRLALAHGFWSVWMTVFADDPDMRRRLVEAFPGTSRACFDDQGRLLARPSGAL